MKWNFDHGDKVTDIEPEEMNEEDINTERREIDPKEVEDVIVDHNDKVNIDNTNSTNFDHPEGEPEFVEPEVVEEQKSIMINGKMLIFIIDTVVPLVIKYGGEYANKSIEINIDRLKMDEEEKEMLSESAEYVAELLFGKLGPIPQFLIGISVIYASKVPEAITKKKK